MSVQPRRPSRYVEPFAGGAGVGLRLLVDEYVDEVVLNDLNPGIAAFWRGVFFSTDDFLDLLEGCPVTVDEWHRQHEVYTSRTTSELELGFATFFLNRTNRSGILDARPIGGLEQRGRWLIDARFDKTRLSDRIGMIARYRTRVTICEEDGLRLVRRTLADDASFIYADPPYLVHGDDLYMDTMRWEDHQRLADILVRAGGWFLTYDADPRITDELYTGLRCAAFKTSHTAAVQHVGDEYAVFADSLRVPSLDGLGSGAASFVCA